MPVTRAPTACSARTNCRWLAGKHGSRKITSAGTGAAYRRGAGRVGDVARLFSQPLERRDVREIFRPSGGCLVPRQLREAEERHLASVHLADGAPGERLGES